MNNDTTQDSRPAKPDWAEERAKNDAAFRAAFDLMAGAYALRSAIATQDRINALRENLGAAPSGTKTPATLVLAGDRPLPDLYGFDRLLSAGMDRVTSVEVPAGTRKNTPPAAPFVR